MTAKLAADWKERKVFLMHVTKTGRISDRFGKIADSLKFCRRGVSCPVSRQELFTADDFERRYRRPQKRALPSSGPYPEPSRKAVNDYAVGLRGRPPLYFGNRLNLGKDGLMAITSRAVCQDCELKCVLTIKQARMNSESAGCERVDAL